MSVHRAVSLPASALDVLKQDGGIGQEWIPVIAWMFWPTFERDLNSIENCSWKYAWIYIMNTYAYDRPIC